MNRKKIKEHLMKAFWILIICFIIFIFGVILYAESTSKYELIGTKQIYSTNLSQQTTGEFHGGFFISSGQIEDKLVYYIYVESENGMKLQSFETDTVELVETDECEPKIETFQRLSDVAGRKFIVYVPVGTVKNHFNVEVK